MALVRESIYRGPTHLYWKFVEDEIEMVIRSPTSSWLGVGWRPSGRGTCSDLEDASEINLKLKDRREEIYSLIEPYLNATDVS